MSVTPPPAAYVLGLFEAHLLVSDVDRSVAFYSDVVGLESAYQMAKREAAFLWSGDRGSSMIGLWARGSAPISLQLHLAFAVSLDDVLEAPKRLRALGVQPLSFFGTPSEEPNVIGWMPAAAVYFADPDGHLLEYIAMLDTDPRPDVGITTWQRWQEMSTSTEKELSVRSGRKETMSP